MSAIQFPAVAGMFYPAQPQVLADDIEHMLQSVEIQKNSTLKGLIVPHAGYVYSGPVAASAYAQLTPLKDRIKRVVLLAPSHHIPFLGIAASSAEQFRTPLGDIRVDRDAVNQALELPQVLIFDEAFTGEHALEVQLPFLQSVLSDFTLVPFILGDASTTEVSELLDTLWGQDETLIVVSSDLSHFLEYSQAKTRDATTSQAIESLHPELIAAGDACGRVPIRGLLQSASKHKLQVSNLDLRNSGDTAGGKDRVVGYGAYAFY